MVTMSYVIHIIEKFGGVRATASALRKPPSTVQGWKHRGTIPDSEKGAVLSAAKVRGIEITKEDFWPSEASKGAA